MEGLLNVTDLASQLDSLVADKMSSLIFMLKAAGILAIIYLLYLLINTIINWRGFFAIRRIEKKVNAIQEKLGMIPKSKKEK